MPVAAMKLIMLGTLAPAVAGLVVKGASSIYVGGGSIGKDLPHLCSVGEVHLLGDSEGTRAMFFGADRDAIQTQVKCLTPTAPCIDTTTCSCPCEYDKNKPLASGGYRQVFYSNIQPLCKSTASSKLLLISLGGGDLTQHLLWQCPKMHVTAVAIDTSVVTVAMNGLGVRQTMERFPNRLEVIASDGYAAAKAQQAESYDVVAVDCMGKAGVIPPSCQSNEFVQEISRVLKPGGTFLQLMWSVSFGPSSARVSADYQDALQRYGKIFEGKLVVLNMHCSTNSIAKVLKVIK